MGARLLLLLALTAATTGCGSKGNSTGRDATPAIKRVDASLLPDVGTAIAGLDEGRLTISPPTNWYVYKNETSKYVVKFTLFKKQDSPLPLILVKSESSPFKEDRTVTEEKLEDFAISMAEIAKQRGGKILEKVKPMVIGGVPCVRYVIQANFKFRQPRPQTILGEQQIIQTLAHGRLYTIELRIREKTISKFRDQAYAVVSSMKFRDSSEGQKDK